MNQHSIATALLVATLAIGANACGDDTTTAPASSLPQTAASATDSPAEPPATIPQVSMTEFDGGATYLTGYVESFTIDEGTLETDADGVGHSRDGTISYRLVTGDARATGMVSGTWNTDRWGDLYDGAMQQWGTAVLTNENGTWEGDYAGGFASPVGDVIARWCAAPGTTRA